jgi:hypothetical protein
MRLNENLRQGFLKKQDSRGSVQVLRTYLKQEVFIVNKARAVIPAQAGIQNGRIILKTGFRIKPFC